MGVSIWEGNKAERVAAALELIALNNAGQASGDLNWKAVQNIVKAGLGEKAFPIGTQFRVKKETSLSASLGVHEGISAVTVTEETFLAAEGMIGTGIHEFVFDGAAWIYNGQPVKLSDYGLAVTGTAANGDEIIVTEAFTEILFDVVDHKITDGKPRMVLLMHDVWYNRPFDSTEALIAVPEALTAGDYHFTYGSTPYQFTLANDVPAGSQMIVSYPRRRPDRQDDQRLSGRKHDHGSADGDAERRKRRHGSGYGGGRRDQREEYQPHEPHEIRQQQLQGKRDPAVDQQPGKGRKLVGTADAFRPDQRIRQRCRFPAWHG